MQGTALRLGARVVQQRFTGKLSLDDWRARQMEAVRLKALADHIGERLAAESFPADFAVHHAHRSRFADAVVVLAPLAGNQDGGAKFFLTQPQYAPNTQTYRAARFYGATAKNRAAVITESFLRRSKSASARMALAAVGALAWNEANRRERAALLFRALVQQRCAVS